MKQFKLLSLPLLATILALPLLADDIPNTLCVGTNKGAKEVGTDLKKQYQFYLDRPHVAGDYHGQAPLLWNAAALREKETE